MPDEITPPPAASLSQAPEVCPYCGTPLHPGFYFCVACATPYQNPENLLPVVRPILTESMAIRLKAPKVWPLFWTYFGVVLGTAVLCYVLMGEGHLGLQILIQSVILFCVTLAFGSIHWQSLSVQFRRIGFQQLEPYIALLLLAPMLGLNYVYHGFLRGLEKHSDMVNSLQKENLDAATLVLLICVLPAILEEIAFRGLVQHWLQTALRPWRAIMLASALFTVLHFSVLSAPYIFVLSLLLGWTKWKTGSLYPCMALHFIHNYAVITWLN